MENSIKDYLVIPPWGIGEYHGTHIIKIKGSEYELTKIYFPKEKATINFPKEKFETLETRKLASPEEINECFEILKTPKNLKRKTWNTIAREYHQKLNSCELKKIAEVIRDTYIKPGIKKDNSQITIHWLAVNLFCSELMIVQNITEEEALKRITFLLLLKYSSG